MKVETWKREGFQISTDPALLDLERMHAFLSSSYWAKCIPRELMERSLRGSVCFGLYAFGVDPSSSREQIGFARAVSDHATFAYIADVYVEEAWRGQGLSKWLMASLLSHPELQGLRRISLGTRDAQGLYAQFGFKNLEKPETWMEIRRQDSSSTLGQLGPHRV